MRCARSARALLRDFNRANIPGMTAGNVEIVRGAYDAFARGDVPAVVGTMDPDIEWIESSAEGLPATGTFKGPEAVVGGVFAMVPGSGPSSARARRVLQRR